MSSNTDTFDERTRDLARRATSDISAYIDPANYVELPLIGYEGSHNNVDQIKEHFDRSYYVRQFQEVYTDDGKNKYKFLVAAKVRNDFVAQMEREFIAMQRSRAQVFASHLSRSVDHENTNGPILGGIKLHPKNILSRGPIE